MQDEKLMFEEECYAIRGAVYEVYRELGNGFDVYPRLHLPRQDNCRNQGR